MSQQMNARIKLNPERLNFPLPMIYARTGHSFRILAEKFPEDCTAPYIRVFRPDGAYFDIPGNIGEDGCIFYIIGTCFPLVGHASYEIHATDSEGNPTAIGEGKLEIKTFSASSSPLEPGRPVNIAQIPAKGGGFVQVRMVQDETGEWVYEALAHITDDEVQA